MVQSINYIYKILLQNWVFVMRLIRNCLFTIPTGNIKKKKSKNNESINKKSLLIINIVTGAIIVGIMQNQMILFPFIHWMARFMHKL